LVEETGVPEKTIDLSQVIGKLYHIMLYRVYLGMNVLSCIRSGDVLLILGELLTITV
jgi:hypothetical protein